MRPALFAIAFVVLACPALATAQVSDAARSAYDEGERQYQAGNHQLALEAFVRVRQLIGDDPRGVLVGYNIAKCHDRLGRDADALREYEQYLADAPSDAPYRTETLDRVRELRGRVAAQAASGPAASAQAASAPASGDSVLGAGGHRGGVGRRGGDARGDPDGGAGARRQAQLGAMCAAGRCPQSAQGVLDDAYLLGTLTDVFWIAGLSVAAIGAALAVVGVVTKSSSPAVTAACMEEGCVAMRELLSWCWC
jgi:tetratricopeptide (TPR) repeat protein